jgi:hypothetical protein
MAAPKLIVLDPPPDLPTKPEPEVTAKDIFRKAKKKARARGRAGVR